MAERIIQILEILKETLNYPSRCPFVYFIPGILQKVEKEIEKLKSDERYSECSSVLDYVRNSKIPNELKKIIEKYFRS